MGDAYRYGFFPSRGSVIPRVAERSGIPAGVFPPRREPWRRAARRSSRDVRDRHGRGIGRCYPSLVLLCTKELALWRMDSGAPDYN